MKVLHIIRDHKDTIPMEMALQDAANGENRVYIVFIHSGVLVKEKLEGINVYVLKDDTEARGIEPKFELIDYNQLVDIIFESDTVVTW